MFWLLPPLQQLLLHQMLPASPLHLLLVHRVTPPLVAALRQVRCWWWWAAALLLLLPGLALATCPLTARVVPLP